MSSIRFALRKLAQQPLFAILAIGTLGIGIGLVTTCFSAVNTMLFRSLPGVAESSRIVLLHQTHTDPQTGMSYKMGVNTLDAQAAVSDASVLESAWLFTELTVIMEGERAPSRYLGATISSHAFDSLGVKPILGRKFTATDGLPEASAVALISHRAWQERFNARPEVIGSKVELNGISTEIIGVMPAGWRYPNINDVWMPLKAHTGEKDYNYRGSFFLMAHGKLAPDVSLTEAQEQLDQVAQSLAVTYPETNSKVGITIESWRGSSNREALYFTVLLFAAGFGIFLIACANVANLQLSRGTARAPEIAVRIALGATRRQIFQQLLIENIVLGLLGAIAGAVVSLWGTDIILASSVIEHPFWFVLDPDWRVLGFITLCGFAASLVFGLIPALRDSKPNLTTAMKEGSRTGLDQGPYGMRLRSAIVVGEIALALVLLVGAGLMTRSFRALQSTDPGYNAENVLTFRVGFPLGYESNENEVGKFYRDLPSRLEGLRDVSSAAGVSNLPGDEGRTGKTTLHPISIENEEIREVTDVCFRHITPNYFTTLAIPLLAGRDFDHRLDGSDVTKVAVVDETYATALGLTPNDLIGRQITLDGMDGVEPDDDLVTIVGVVGAIRHSQDATRLIPTCYLPASQTPNNFMSIVMRTTVKPNLLEQSVRKEVLALHPGMPIYYVFSLEQVILRSIWEQYFFSRMFLCIGLVAVLLACVGIYGVMTFSVTMRHQEIGLRMALGASSEEVVRDIVRRGSHLVVFGLGSGFIAAFLLANLLSGFLHGVTPHDPPTFVTVPIILAAVALGACYLSSRRATRINPMTAMRSE